MESGAGARPVPSPSNVWNAACGHRLDSDRSPIELEIHLATAGKADSIPEHARDDQSPRLVNGGPHAINTTTVMGARHARGKAAHRPLLDKARHRDIT
jgi:hypothetical protein